MPCYTPLILYRSRKGPDPVTGKVPLTNEKNGDISKPVLIPCGRCIGCKLENSRQWAVRCIQEAQMHQENCFITLTYSDENLTHGGQQPTLYPRDLQLFLKRLRKKYGNGIRFFACGEYGDTFGRPHYHACIFGIDFNDKILFSTREDINLYTSQTLSNLWGLGHCTIGDVNFETAAYVARYILKKQTGKKAQIYTRTGIIPEFTRMSRRPGLGFSWYEKYKGDLFPHDFTVIRDGIKIKPPKYYSNKYELENPAEFAIIKARREKQAAKKLPENTSKRRLNDKRYIQQQKLDRLKRTLS